MKSQITTKKLRKVRNMLPSNAYETIAKELDVSVSTISRVFTGKNKRLVIEVLDKALDIIRDEETKLSNISSEIDQL